MYKCGDTHSNHTEHGRIPKDTQDVILSLFKDGTSKPNAVILALRNRGIQGPPRRQLTNYLTYLRKKLLGRSTISMGEMEKWCKERKVLMQILLNCKY